MVPLQLCLEQRVGERDCPSTSTENTYWSHRAQPHPNSHLPCDLNILQLSKLLLKSCEPTQFLRLKSLLPVLIIKIRDLNKSLIQIASQIVWHMRPMQKHEVSSCSFSIMCDLWAHLILSPSILVSFFVLQMDTLSFIHHSRPHSPPGALMAWWA